MSATTRTGIDGDLPTWERCYLTAIGRNGLWTTNLTVGTVKNAGVSADQGTRRIYSAGSKHAKAVVVCDPTRTAQGRGHRAEETCRFDGQYHCTIVRKTKSSSFLTLETGHIRMGESLSTDSSNLLCCVPRSCRSHRLAIQRAVPWGTTEDSFRLLTWLVGCRPMVSSWRSSRHDPGRL